MRLILLAVLVSSLGCAAVRPGSPAPRTGDEIVVCGRLYHTGAPVVLWTDPGGYDAYRVERRFVPWEQAGWTATAADKKLAQPERFGLRYGGVPGKGGLTQSDIDRVRGGGWDLPTLQRTVDQFVLHYDAAGTSRTCFRILHDVRGLSVHFMLDLDGTIYQTLDVKERAWHATVSNDRSVGIEIANIGAYPPGETGPLDRWYSRDAHGTRLTIPPALDGGGVRTPGTLRPARDRPITGAIQGRELVQYDLTPQQYESLIRLTATLCTVLPQIRCDCPRDDSGVPLDRALSADDLAAFKGILGHHHIQTNKTDPGPALDWDRVVHGAKSLMR
jgi:N-acetylmuramoyl-L-alanine amidase